METLQKKKTATGRITFGLFEADLRAGELWKAGHRIKLQALPFKVLTILVENAGEVVTREELQMGVWGPDVVVDFEHSLSNAIKKLRSALGDSADNPRFIETLSRRGFRFIAPVGLSEPRQQISLKLPIKDAEISKAPENLAATDQQPAIALPNTLPSTSWKIYWLSTGCFILGLVLAAVLLHFINSRKSVAEIPRITRITQDGTVYASKDHLLGALSAFANDGAHLFSPVTENGEVLLARISVSSGDSQTLPLLKQIGAPEVLDISPDGTRLLVKSNLASAVQQPLWVVSTDGGAAFRISDVLAQSGTWMPDGKNILYASGNQLAEVSLDDERSTKLATVPGRAFWPRWSPDGTLLRFTIVDPVDHTSSLWELPKNGNTPRHILKTMDASVRQCCGVWTADGKWYVFEATKEGRTDLWRVGTSPDSEPIRITNGPLNNKAPSPGRQGGEIFFVGQDIRSGLQHFDPQRKEYVAQQGFLAAADHVQYSADGHWVIWTDSGHRLWRARVDGSDKVLLTPSSMWVYMASCSLDCAKIAFMAREPRQPWQIYTVAADGGPAERLLKDNQNLGDPSNSPDGKSLVFGTVPSLIDEGGGAKQLWFFNLSTRTRTPVPNSNGLYSPRWSPDGRFIAAITLDQKELRLYDTRVESWKTLAVTSAALPVWSKDSRYLYVHAYRASNRPILRISIPDGKVEQVADLNNFRSGNITHADFAGLSPEGSPLMHAEVSSGDLYSVDLSTK
jgi:Tol biopolymer transport system component/DNA-binding winged helix-turn-helix (wHTH) protein